MLLITFLLAIHAVVWGNVCLFSSLFLIMQADLGQMKDSPHLYPTPQGCEVDRSHCVFLITKHLPR